MDMCYLNFTESYPEHAIRTDIRSLMDQYQRLQFNQMRPQTRVDTFPQFPDILSFQNQVSQCMRQVESMRADSGANARRRR